MVFGLSSSKSRNAGRASDHLPSANNLSQRVKKKTPKAAEHPKNASALRSATQLKAEMARS
jgi:hypothetical protein